MYPELRMETLECLATFIEIHAYVYSSFQAFLAVPSLLDLIYRVSPKNATSYISRPVPVARNFTSEGMSYLGGYLPTGISFHCYFFMVLS